MKQIRIFALHRRCTDVDSFVNYIQLPDLKDKFEFVWDEDNPDYLFVTEHIYLYKKIRKDFNRLFYRAKITIFFTREAVSPDFNLFDYAFGFDYNLENGDRFTRIPGPIDLWPKFCKERTNSIGTIEQAREELLNKKGFCCFLYSNYLAHPNRDKLFWLISKYKRVDSLGRHLNNVELKGTGYKGHEFDGVTLKSAYKFSIASENSSFDGYTCEKIITSLEAHTVPVYFGDPHVSTYINPDCFIDCSKYINLDEVVDTVKKVDSDDSLWCKMISAPWQTKEQEREAEKRKALYHDRFHHIFEGDINDNQRKAIGAFATMYESHITRNTVRKKSIISRLLLRLKYK